MSARGEREQRDKGKRLRKKPLGTITLKDQIEEGNPATLLRRRRETGGMFHKHRVREELTSIGSSVAGKSRKRCQVAQAARRPSLILVRIIWTA